MKKLIALFILLFVVNIQAADYLDSTKEIYSNIRKNLSISDAASGVEDSVVKPYVIDGAIAVSMVASGDYVIDTIIMSSGVLTYALDSSIIIVDRVMLEDSDLVYPLKLMAQKDWDDISANTRLLKEEGGLKKPDHYDWNDGFIHVYPSPIAVDTLIIHGYKKVISVVTDSAFVANFPLTYRPAVVYYATSLLALKLGMTDAAVIWDKAFDKWVMMINNTIHRRDYEPIK
jgi:hypothetical protein